MEFNRGARWDLVTLVSYEGDEGDDMLLKSDSRKKEHVGGKFMRKMKHDGVVRSNCTSLGAPVVIVDSDW